MERWTRGCVALGLAALTAGPAAASPAVPLALTAAATAGQAGPAGPSGPAAGVSRLPARHAGPVDNLTACRRHLAEARAAYDRRDAVAADRSLRAAEQLAQGLPETAFAEGELQPWQLRLAVDKALGRAAGPATVRPVGFTDPFPATPTGPAPAISPADPQAGRLHFEAGMQAVATGDREGALLSFEKAWDLRAGLDPRTQQALQDQMNQIRGMAAKAAPAAPIDPEAQRQQALRQSLLRQITNETALAERLRVTDPRGSLEKLQVLQASLEGNREIDDLTRQKMILIVDRDIVETESYIRDNLAQIELEERNDAVKAEIQRSDEERIAVQQKVAELVAQFNTLLDEQRYAEAEVVAKQAHAIAPDFPQVEAMIWQATFVKRIREGERIASNKEHGFADALQRVEESSIPFDDGIPLQYGDAARTWETVSARRLQALEDRNGRRSPAELQIEQALTTPVDVRFTNTPLADVMTRLGDMVGINVHIDTRGLANEGVPIDQPVTLNLPRPISLKSALDTILHPLGLDAEIQNEMLLITSGEMTDKNLRTVTYEVGDLVMPIPNFVPSTDFGLSGAMKEAYSLAQFSRGVQQLSPAGENLYARNEAINKSGGALAQMSANGLLTDTPGANFREVAATPDALGGASMADYTALIDLITSTVAPESWDEVGGPASIRPFATNLTLVVSQTQENHEAVADLLRQLRRLQDLQVTIEVRFITLRDDFFERIGVDFDFKIDDNIVNFSRFNGADAGPSTTVGLQPVLSGGYNPQVPLSISPNRTLDNDLVFSQNSFGSALPQFGGFDPASAANFGFAILSDVEMYLLLQAAQGDTRSNVLQAPKVTLFNGQTAVISDTVQTPFVTSVIPVVGDFSVGQQPVVVVLNEGTQLSVQATVSHDRRFCRLTLVPFFSRIGNVTTFTFQQKTSYNTGTSFLNPAGAILGANGATVSTEGTTVQQPEFAQTSVTTTVSVPDGGTILLGGIKRLSEGRTERGVPMLSKIPYINRLFRNVGVGRETSSLMFMVTPRIIIQEEEEFDQTQYQAPN